MITITKSRKDTPRPTPGLIDFHRAAERIKQVSNLTRLRVLLLLGDGEGSVGALSSELSCSMTTLSRNLALLHLAGLVVPRRDAHRNIYGLTGAGRVLRRVVLGLVG
jgi:DNA-binding HxlR family transcriptional regulator